MGEIKKTGDHKMDLTPLVVAGAFLTAVGDFITFLAVLFTAQKQHSDKKRIYTGDVEVKK